MIHKLIQNLRHVRFIGYVIPPTYLIKTTALRMSWLTHCWMYPSRRYEGDPGNENILTRVGHEEIEARDGYNSVGCCSTRSGSMKAINETTSRFEERPSETLNNSQTYQSSAVWYVRVSILSDTAPHVLPTYSRSVPVAGAQSDS